MVLSTQKSSSYKHSYKIMFHQNISCVEYNIKIYQRFLGTLRNEKSLAL